jgi:hypothetical protein
MWDQILSMLIERMTGSTIVGVDAGGEPKRPGPSRDQQLGHDAWTQQSAALDHDSPTYC